MLHPERFLRLRGPGDEPAFDRPTFGGLSLILALAMPFSMRFHFPGGT